MKLACPSCKAILEVPDGMAGQLMVCANCSQSLKVPAKEEAPEAKPPEAPRAEAPTPAVAFGSVGTGGAGAGAETISAAATPATPTAPALEPAHDRGPQELGPRQETGQPRPMLSPEQEAQPASLTAADEAKPKRYGTEPQPAASGAMDAAKGAAGGVGEAVGSLPVLGDLVKSFQPLVSAFGKVGSVVSSIFGGAKGGGKSEGVGQKSEGEGGKSEGESQKSEGEGGKSKLALVGEALGAIASVGSAVVNTFSQLVGVAGSFVQQFNPSLMNLLGMTMRDFQATVGSGLTPVIQTAIGSLRFLADALVEPMKALRPAVASISQAFGGLLNSLSTLLGEVLTGLAPALGVVGQLFGLVSITLQVCVNAFRAVVGILSPLISAISSLIGGVLVPFQSAGELANDAMRGVAAIAAGVGATLGAMFEYVGSLFGGVGGWFSGLGSAIQGLLQWVVKAGITLAAMVGRFLGGSAFLDGMIKSLEGPKKDGSVGMAAGQNAQVTSIGSVTNALYAAAFTSQKVGPDSKKEDPMKDMVDTLKAMKDGSGPTIQSAIEAAAPAIANALKTVITGAATGAAEYVGGGIYNAGRSAGEAAAGINSAVYDYTIGAAGRALLG